MRGVVLCALLVACGSTTSTDDGGVDATTNDVVVAADSSSDANASDAGVDVVAADADAQVDAGPACDADLSNDPLNCGSCTHVCAEGGVHTTPTCSSSTCGIACVDPFADCDKDASTGCETNTNSDMSNCGTCGTACNAPEATSACVSGKCTITQCAAGYGDCDLTYTNGCETSLQTSPTNCGTCNNPCPYGPNSSAVCINTNCGIVCSQGFADCDNNPATGCEVNVYTDKNHCGTCNMACGTTQNCVNGQCQ